jgi:hypothetical protein
MSEKNPKRKSKYESPIVAPLGEIAKGSGVCSAGSSVAPAACVPGGADTVGLACTCGPSPVGPTDCSAGQYAAQDCSAGPSANRDCSRGTCAVRDCTAGVSATGTTCSAGGAV